MTGIAEDVTTSVDLVDLIRALVAVPSCSGQEDELVERRLRARAPHLAIHRGNEVVARTTGAAGKRLIFAGHLDTVPPIDFGPADSEPAHGPHESASRSSLDGTEPAP